MLQFSENIDRKRLDKQVGVFSDSWYEGNRVIDKEYEQKVINIEKSFHEQNPAINVSMMDEIRLYDCALSSLLGDCFSISVFFDGDLKPVSDLVAMARLFDFFEKNKKTKHDDFSAFFMEASAYGLAYGNMSALSWEKYLPIFLKETNNLDKTRIREILSSGSEVSDPLEVSKQWFILEGLDVLGRFFRIEDGKTILSAEEIKKREEYFKEHSIKQENDGRYYINYEVIEKCIGNLWDYERDGPIDYCLYPYCDNRSTFLYSHGEIKPSYKKEYEDYKKHIGETTLPGHFHIADTYITSHFKRMMEGA